MAYDNAQDETVPTTPRGVDVDFDLDGTRTVIQSHAPDRSPPVAGEPSANHIALPVGYTLQEYTIEDVLGAGGFGITYLARDNNLQCQVAIKEYLPNDLAVRAAGKTVLPRTESDTHGYQVGLDRFLAETRVLAGFRHPNIVRVNRFFEANHTAYMVMDYEHGQSLRDWLSARGSVDEATLKRMFLPLLDGLEIVHGAGVVHRDIKPANIYVRDSDGSLVLLDFGAARQTTGVASKSLTSIITPGYAPFEQYHTRGAQGPWTDLYALGGVLYWLVTGQKPLEAPTRVKHDTMVSAVEAGAGRFSPAFLAAIDWALTVDEETRPRSVAGFRPVLLGEAPVPVPPRSDTAGVPAVPPAPTSSTEAARNSGLKFAGIGAALAIVAALVFLVLPKSPAPAPGPATTAASSEGVPPATGAPARTTPARTAQARAPAGVKRTPAVKGNDTPDDQVAILLFEIVPPGEQATVSVDGRKIGSAPPLREFKVAPGKHKIEIHGSRPPGVYLYWVNLDPKERKKLWAKFADEN